MAVEASAAAPTMTSAVKEGHRAWVRACHWVVAISFLVLCFSGIYIFAVHPRLYWGEVGNDLMPAILEIPISANHQPEGWERTATFPLRDGEVFTASRTYSIFNQNGWARSLHFLAAWFLVVTGLVYLLTALVSGHAWRNLLPGARELSPGKLWRDVKDHMPSKIGSSGGGIERMAGIAALENPLPLLRPRDAFPNADKQDEHEHETGPFRPAPAPAIPLDRNTCVTCASCDHPL